MNIKTVKKAEKRVEYPSIASLGILAYGDSNLYPQEIKNLAGSSDSATSCLNRYTDFIEGWGFADVKFAETLLNKKGETADTLAALIAGDIANFSGFALHVNYNLLGKIVEIQHVPFENCRLCEPDENGEISKIAVHPDWTGKTKRAGKYLRVTRENIDYINIFNPENVLREIEECGGIAAYGGQILWVSAAGRQTYPVPRHDSIIPQMSAEEGLANIATLNTRNNFLPSGFLLVKKSVDTVHNEQEGVQQEAPAAGIGETIKQIKSDENTSSIAVLEFENDEDIPKFINIKGNNYDKDFTVTASTATEKIYAAFSQEVFYRIRSGSMGFSTEIMSQAYEYYSTVTSRERRMIERVFDKIMKFWAGGIFNGFTVKPMEYVSKNYSGITPELLNTLTVNEKRELIGFDSLRDIDSNTTTLAEKIGVGGTAAMTQIISDTAITPGQKRGLLKVLFALTDNDLNLIFPGAQ